MEWKKKLNENFKTFGNNLTIFKDYWLTGCSSCSLASLCVSDVSIFSSSVLQSLSSLPCKIQHLEEISTKLFLFDNLWKWTLLLLKGNNELLIKIITVTCCMLWFYYPVDQKLRLLPKRK